MAEAGIFNTLTAVIEIKLHKNIILQNPESLQLFNCSLLEWCAAASK